VDSLILFSVIPDYAKMQWIVRAPTFAQAVTLAQRVENCFKYINTHLSRLEISNALLSGAALSTACVAKVKVGRPYYDLRQNPILGVCLRSSRSGLRTERSPLLLQADEFAAVSKRLYGLNNILNAPSGASTDFVCFLGHNNIHILGN